VVPPGSRSVDLRTTGKGTAAHILAPKIQPCYHAVYPVSGDLWAHNGIRTVDLRTTGELAAVPQSTRVSMVIVASTQTNIARITQLGDDGATT
jgi:hypothetical protein